MNVRIQTIVAGIAIAAAASLAGTPATASARPGPADPSPAPQPAASNEPPKAAATINYPNWPDPYAYRSAFADNDKTTTMNLKSGHPTYNIYLGGWAKQAGNGNVAASYNITMYQGNKVVWSAANQTARTYSVGGNVTKVVMTRNVNTGYNQILGQK